MSDNTYGIVTEQGYPIGQFGFSPINEEDKRNIEETTAKETSKKLKENQKSED